MSTAPALCLTFDNLGQAKDVFDGKAALPDRDAPSVRVAYPRLLALLSEFGVRATFFIEGWSALHLPETVDALQQAGHEVALHGWIHERFAELDRRSALQSISDSCAALKAAGVDPLGFRAPGGARGPFAAEILAERGFLYDSSVDSVFAPAAPAVEPEERLSEEPRWLRPDLIGVPWRWSMIDAVHYLLATSGLRDPAALARYWCSAIDAIARQGGTLTIIGHAHISAIDDDRLAALRRVIAHTLDAGIAIRTAKDTALAFKGAQSMETK